MGCKVSLGGCSGKKDGNASRSYSRLVDVAIKPQLWRIAVVRNVSLVSFCFTMLLHRCTPRRTIRLYDPWTFDQQQLCSPPYCVVIALRIVTQSSPHINRTSPEGLKLYHSDSLEISLEAGNFKPQGTAASCHLAFVGDGLVE